MHAFLCTALHHLIVALHVACDEDNLSAETLPRIAQQSHCVRAAASLLAVPQNHALGLDMLVDQARDSGSKCALLV